MKYNYKHQICLDRTSSKTHVCIELIMTSRMMIIIRETSQVLNKNQVLDQQFQNVKNITIYTSAIASLWSDTFIQ